MPNRITILDGGMGRELKRLGAPFRQPEWSALALMEAPEQVARAHDAFIMAGADVITTNSYAVVPFHIGERTFAQHGQSLAALSGKLARNSASKAGHAVSVAGSLPPLFGSYRPDLFDASLASNIITPLVAGLSPYVDVWLAETLSSQAEVQVVAEALANDDRPRWFSFTLEDGEPAAFARPPRLRSGESIEQALKAAAEAGASAVLFNCSQAELMEGAIRRAREVVIDVTGSTFALGVYANSFAPQSNRIAANAGISELREDLDIQAYLAFARRWREAGAAIIGGCCGIGPEHIATLSQAIRLPAA